MKIKKTGFKTVLTHYLIKVTIYFSMKVPLYVSSDRRLSYCQSLAFLFDPGPNLLFQTIVWPIII